MSRSGRAVEFMRAWRNGKTQAHIQHGWGQDDCDACTAELYDEWQAVVRVAEIMGWADGKALGVDPQKDRKPE